MGSVFAFGPANLAAQVGQVGRFVDVAEIGFSPAQRRIVDPLEPGDEEEGAAAAAELSIFMVAYNEAIFMVAYNEERTIARAVDDVLCIRCPFEMMTPSLPESHFA